jgi:hypothetical protein
VFDNQQQNKRGIIPKKALLEKQRGSLIKEKRERGS